MPSDEVLAARSRLRKLVRRLPCPQCGEKNSPYSDSCTSCKADLTGGVIFSAAQSGTAQAEWLADVRAAIESKRSCAFHDVGATMEKCAREFDPDINWDRILDRPEEVLKFRRAQAFSEISKKILDSPKKIHLLACHLTFRWRAYLMRGFDPHLISALREHLRLFLTVIDGVNDVRSRLARTEWGERKRLELAIWRDEEVFITGLLADTFRRPHYVVARQEPADNMANLILAPWQPRVYLSFPITAFVGQPDEGEMRAEVELVRDTIRRWAVVFDPFAIKDYDLTYQVPEMKEISKELGEQTEQRDFGFIDQSEILVAFYPKAVASKGVEAELRHARTTGKLIYLCYPGATGGPFSTPPDYFCPSRKKLVSLLRSHLESLDSPEDG